MFFYVGVRTLRGLSAPIPVTGVASRVLAGGFLTALVINAYNGVALFLGAGILFHAAAVLALLGRKKYEAWRGVRNEREGKRCT
jgi:hypothetical protein